MNVTGASGEEEGPSFLAWIHCKLELTPVSCTMQFLNPGILVKKPGKLPEGHINTWFWEKGNMKDTLPTKLPGGETLPALPDHARLYLDLLCKNLFRLMLLLRFADLGSRVQLGEAQFGKYPENLLHSRVRYSKAFQVRPAPNHTYNSRCVQTDWAL